MTDLKKSVKQMSINGEVLCTKVFSKCGVPPIYRKKPKKFTRKKFRKQGFEMLG